MTGEETIPLLVESHDEPQDLLTSFIENNLLDKSYLTATGDNVTKAIRIFATIFGSTAGIPFVQPAMDAAGSYIVLGYFFAVGTLIAFAAGTIWVFHQIIDDLKPKTTAETQLLAKNKYSIIAFYLAVHVLSIITTIIPTYTAYKYNDNKWVLFINVPITYAFNVFGFSKLLSILSKRLKRNLTGEQKKTLNNAQRVIEHILYRINPTLLVLDTAEIKTLRSVLFKENPSQLIETLVQAVIRSEYKELSRQFYGGYPRIIFQAMNFTFPAFTAILNFQLASEAVALITSNEILHYLLTILVISPGFGIDTFVTITTAGRIFDSFFNMLKRNPNTNLLSSHFKINSALLTASIIFASLSSSNKGYVAYTTANENLRLVLTIAVVMNSIIFETRALCDLYFKLFDLLIARFGNERYKTIVDIQTRMGMFIEMLTKAEPTKYIEYFNKHAILIETIPEYIGSNVIEPDPTSREAPLPDEANYQWTCCTP